MTEIAEEVPIRSGWQKVEQGRIRCLVGREWVYIHVAPRALISAFAVTGCYSNRACSVWLRRGHLE